DRNDVLAGRGPKAYVQPACGNIPAHRQPSAPTITKLRASQRRCPALRLQPLPRELIGQAALLECQMIFSRQVLQIAAATGASMNTGLDTALLAGNQDPLAARLDHLAARHQHARLDLFARQGAFDEPGSPFNKGNATPVVGQTLDTQALFLAHRNLCFLHAPAGLKAQATTVSGHQWLQPIKNGSLIWVRRKRRWTDNDRPGRK